MRPFSPAFRQRCAVAFAAALALATGLATAQTAPAYPDKPLRIMVGASPGGGTDILARVLADKLSPALKQPVVVENRPGASNTIAGELTARAPADGATLLLATNTAQAVAPHILKLKYDPLKDLQPLGLVAVMPNVLVVSASSPYRSVKDLLAAMAAKPGGFKYASSGIGSTQHVGGEAFNLATGMKSVHVPYKGSSQAHIDIIAGEVEMMFDSTSSAMGQIKAGKFRALAVSAPQRSPELPDVPTLAERYPGLEVFTWLGFWLPAKTPPEIVDRFNREIRAATQSPEMQKLIAEAGLEPMGTTPEETRAIVRREAEAMGKLIKAKNIRID